MSEIVKLLIQQLMQGDKKIEQIVQEIYQCALLVPRTTEKQSLRIKYAESYFPDDNTQIIATQSDKFQQQNVQGQQNNEKEESEQDFQESEVMSKQSVTYNSPQKQQTNAMTQKRVSVISFNFSNNNKNEQNTNVNENIDEKVNKKLNENTNESNNENTNENINEKTQKLQKQKDSNKNNVNDNEDNYSHIAERFESIKSNVRNQNGIFYVPLEIDLIVEPFNCDSGLEVNQIVKINNYENQINQNFNNDNAKEKEKECEIQDQNHFQIVESEIQQQNTQRSQEIQRMDFDDYNNFDQNISLQEQNKFLLKKINVLESKLNQLQKNNTLGYRNRIIDSYKNDSTNRSEKIKPIDGFFVNEHYPQSTSSSMQLKNFKSAENQIKNQRNSISSGLYNIKISSQFSGSVLDQIRFLKNKIQQLEKRQIQSNSSTSNKKGQDNFFSFRKNLQGKIFRRRGSVSSPLQSDPLLQDNSTINEESMYPKTTTLENEFQGNNAKESSSAIFRRTPISNSRCQPQTLEFNPQFQKFPQDSLNLAPSNYPSEQNELSEFQVPHFSRCPKPHNSFEELLQIGRAAFRKMGIFSVNQKIQLKKYENCIHYKISDSENIIWHFDNKIYVGGFDDVNSWKSGQGVEIVYGKYVFQGNFHQGKRKGFGKLRLKDGTGYEGQWSGGREGWGRSWEPDGTIYTGMWKNNKKHGEGKITLKGELIFQGNFREGIKFGYGMEFFPNGDTYKGQYDHNKFHGKGLYTWASGAFYEGEFRTGTRGGKGRWVGGAGGDVYEGGYWENKKNGFGIYRWSNGVIYEGQFKNDVKHGEGVIKYPNGKVKKMKWVNGRVQNNQNQSLNSYKDNSNQSSAKSIAPKIPPRSAISRSLSSNKLQRANSASATNTHIPKGIKFRTNNNGELSTQFRNKVMATDFVKIGIEPKKTRKDNHNILKNLRQGISQGCSQPYISARTSTIINLSNL